MKLDVDSLARSVHHLVCVAAVAVHVTETVRCATATEQDRNLVGRLWAQRQEVPEHIRILERQPCRQVLQDQTVSQSLVN